MMEDKTRTEANTLSSQVLEYFRKHSGDQNLSSYLRGIIPENKHEISTVCNEPQRKANPPVASEELRRPPLIGQDKEKIDPTTNPSNIEVLHDQSPTSSVTSTKKLEWDNGADIGYENSNRQSLHKSLSLPILTTLEKIELGKKPLRQSPEGNVADSSRQIYYHVNASSSSSNNNSYKKPEFFTSSSSSNFVEECKIDTTTSSFTFKCDSNDSNSVDIHLLLEKEKDLQFSHEKVGKPIASSSPAMYTGAICRKLASESSSKTSAIIADEPQSPCEPVSSDSMDNNDSPKTESTSNDLGLSKLKCVAKFIKKRIINLRITKPISVECINYKESYDKDIQTSLNSLKTNSIGIQTEQKCNVEKIIEKTILPTYEERQVIQYLKFSESSDEPGLRSLGTNTNSEIAISNCNSFEYLFPDEKLDVEHQLGNAKNINSNQTTISSDSGKTLSSNITNVSSKTNPLGDMIACNLSKHMSVDIEKSITLLQRLLKSKRYDKITKEYYVKKIIDKILQSNYVSDTSSSRKEDDNALNQEPVQSSSSSKVSENVVEASLSHRLQENVPWVPATLIKSDPPPQNKRAKKLEIKTFSDNISPEKERPRKLKDSRFTITSTMCDHKGDYHKSYVLPEASQCSTSETSENEQNKSKRLRSFQSWKDNLTQSEKILEEGLTKSDGDKSDTLVRFAKKERESQINWINNEISHLNKLRSLLQENNINNENSNNINYNKTKPKIQVDILTKPHVEDMRKMKKSASVYVITTDKTSPPQTPKRFNERGTKSRTNTNNVQNLTCHEDTCPSLNNFIGKSRITIPPSQDVPNFNVNPDLKEAKLISSEIYKTDEPFSCVRRYVFEIPVDCICDTRQKGKASNAGQSTFYRDHGADGLNRVTSHVSRITEKSERDCKCIGSETERIYKESYTEGNVVYRGFHSGKKLPVDHAAITKPPITDRASITNKITQETKHTEYKSASMRHRGSATDRSSSVEKGSFSRPSVLHCACNTTGTTYDTKEIDNSPVVRDRGSSTDRPASLSGVSKGVDCEHQVVDKGSSSRPLGVHCGCNTDNKTYDTKETSYKTPLQSHRGSVTEKCTPCLTNQGTLTEPSIKRVIHRGASTDKQTSASKQTDYASTRLSQSDPSTMHKSSMTEARYNISPTLSMETKVYPSSVVISTLKPGEYSKEFGAHVSPEKANKTSVTEPRYPSVVNRSSMTDTIEEEIRKSFSKGIQLPLERQAPTSSQGTNVLPETTTSYAGSDTFVDPQSKRRISNITEAMDIPFRTHGIAATDTNQENDSNARGRSLKKTGTEEITDTDTKKGSSTEVTKSEPHPKSVKDTKKAVQSSKKEKKSSSSSSATTTSTTTSSSQSIRIQICPCCKRKESKYLSMIKGLPKQIDEALCQPCYNNTQIKTDPYTGRYVMYPNHVCSCYTYMKTEAVRKIKDTVKELENLENEDKYCACSHKCNCQHYGNQRKGIAYTLTLEDDERSESDIEEIPRHSLDEIKVKIPSLKGLKRHRSKKHDHKHNRHHKKGRKEKSASRMTLQDYLCANKPNFVQSAEQRRKAMVELAYLREQRCEKYKQLLAMTKGIPFQPNSDDTSSKKRKGIFTSKEMKEITCKNYKKLPEVQRRLDVRRENNIRKANRILAGMFNKKVQQNTLKGNVCFSTTTSVVKFI